MEPKLFTAQEFSDLTGVPRGTLRRWKHEKKLTPVIIGGATKPNYYSESQIPIAIKLFQMASKSRRENFCMANIFSSEEDNNNMETSTLQNPTFDNQDDDREDDELPDPPIINVTEEKNATDDGDTTAANPVMEHSDPCVSVTTAAIEPAPIIDTEKSITEPLEEKSLEELAKEANLYTARGDNCFKQGLTYYFAAGRRLNEAKSRLEHGQWQTWLTENFSASADTASNYMKLARRFGESKSEPFRNLGLATAIKMLALPVGDEDAFIEEQAKSGKPVETQTAREVQASIKHWKQNRHKEKQDSTQTANSTPIPVDDETEEPTDEVKGTYINLTGKPANDVVADELNAQTANHDTPTEPTTDVQTPAVDVSGRLNGVPNTEPNNLSLQEEKALESIRQLIHDEIQAATSLQALRVSLCKLLQITDAELDKQKHR